MSSTGTSLISFDPSTLLNYYQSKLPVAPSSTLSGATAAATKQNATAHDVPPWEITPPAQTARDAQTLAITNFVDTSNVPLLSGIASDAKMEQDNQKLFTLYNAVNNLTYLAGMSKRDGMTAGQMAGFNARFQTGLQQVQSYVASTTFNNFTLQAGSPSSSITSAVSLPFAPFAYKSGTLVSDKNIANALPGVGTSDSFAISVKKGGVTSDVAIDLSQVQGPLSIDNIVNYVNQQLAAGGFDSRFHRVITSGSINDVANASYGISIAPSGSESVSLSSASATPALYLASTTGTQTATADTAQDNQGRLVKLTNLSTAPQSAFSATVAPSSGTTTAQSTVVDANGNVYVAGTATGDFGTQLNQGTQDAYLTKYDSAGNLQWTKLLGSAGSATGYSLALNPAGGVVVAGSTTGDLTPTAIANGNTDSFVAKYDGDGNQTWTKQIQTLSANQANAVSVDALGNIYLGGQVTGVIGSGQTNAGNSDAYLAKLDAKGNIVYEQQFGTSGKDQVAATATAADGGLVVASVQNGHAILSKYAGGDATAPAAWEVDLGDLQNGSIGGLTVSGNQVYVSGSTQNGNLTAGGQASIAEPGTGGSDAFVFNLTDQDTSATPSHVSYVGTGGADKGGAVTVGPDGTVYLAGTTTGTFAGATRNVADVNNTFVSALGGDGTVQWTRQYGGAGGQSTGQGVAIDAAGSSVLDALGLPRGPINLPQSVDLTQQTTLRAGDSLQIQIQGSTTRTATVKIDQGETLKSLTNKINVELQNAGSASVSYGSGEGLKIAVNPGYSATLIAGPANFDALARLGIAAGKLTNASTGTAASANISQPQVYGLGLATNMNISTTTSAGAARAQLLSVLSAIQTAYQKSNAPPVVPSTMPQSPGTVSASAQAQLANYNLALGVFSADPSSAVSNIAQILSTKA